MSAKEWEKIQLLDPSLRAKAIANFEQSSSPRSSSAKKTDPAKASRLSDRAIPGGGRLALDEGGDVVGVDFWFHVRPVPKERPRVVRTRSGKISTYTPQRTKALADGLKPVIRSILPSQCVFDAPVSLHMFFLFSPPASWPVWKRELSTQGLLFPTSRPDLDNLEKALLDVFNETVFVDDSLVVDRTATKMHFAETGILVSLRRFQNPSAQSLNAKKDLIPFCLDLDPLALSLPHCDFRSLSRAFLDFVEA